MILQKLKYVIDSNVLNKFNQKSLYVGLTALSFLEKKLNLSSRSCPFEKLKAVVMAVFAGKTYQLYCYSLAFVTIVHV
jgi:hypothetical protein